MEKLYILNESGEEKACLELKKGNEVRLYDTYPLIRVLDVKPREATVEVVAPIYLYPAIDGRFSGLSRFGKI